MCVKVVSDVNIFVFLDIWFGEGFVCEVFVEL